MNDLHVFISYSHNDIEVTKALVQFLESVGLKCWYAPRDIEPGAEWANSIVNAIQRAPYFVLVFSESSNQSDQVYNEVDMACKTSEMKHKVINLRISNVEVSARMSYYLNGKLWVDATEDPGRAYKTLAKQIRTDLGMGGADPSVTRRSETSADRKAKKKQEKAEKLRKRMPSWHRKAEEAACQEEERLQKAREKGKGLKADQKEEKLETWHHLARKSLLTKPEFIYEMRKGRKEDIQPSSWTCPSCGRQNDDSGMFCETCGARRDALKASDYWFCPICGTPNNIRGMFCTGCGSRRGSDDRNVERIDDLSSEKAFGRKESPAETSFKLKEVEFSVVAPKMMLKGEYTLINVVMYEESYRNVVDRMIHESDEPTQESRSGIHRVEDDSRVKVVLYSPDIILEDDTETGIWRGKFLNFSFAFFLPEQYERQQILFFAFVYVNDLIATRLKFIVKCRSSLEQKIEVTRDDVFSAFMSYASQDRNRVAAIVQGMRKARPDMDIFFDVESLRSGDNWEPALYHEIENRDILFLCWSRYARESEWVGVEWRYALKNKGEESIEPIPIDPPDLCPPPKELEHKHFNDKLLYIIRAE